MEDYDNAEHRATLKKKKNNLSLIYKLEMSVVVAAAFRTLSNPASRTNLLGVF